MPYTEMELTEIKLALIAGHAKREPDSFTECGLSEAMPPQQVTRTF